MRESSNSVMRTSSGDSQFPGRSRRRISIHGTMRLPTARYPSWISTAGCKASARSSTALSKNSAAGMKAGSQSMPSQAEKPASPTATIPNVR
jgi:hypothetical protein